MKKGLIPAISFLLCLISILPAFCEEAIIESKSVEHRIKRGNLLHIDVLGHPDLSNREITVNSDGMIVFPPLIKAIKADGKTPVELAIAMETELAEFIKYPKVTVSYHNTFFIYGEVNRPGEFPLPGHVNALKAIIIGGGFTDFGSHRIKIIKSSGERKHIWVNVDNIISGKGRDKDTLIEPGDIIVVPQSLF